MATLVRALGPAQLDLAESSVQEAFLKALRLWPIRGVPDRPDAWLYTTARNRAIDTLRRRSRFEERADTFAHAAEAAPPESANFPGELVDDQLRLMFLCCHEALPRTSRGLAMLIRP